MKIHFIYITLFAFWPLLACSQTDINSVEAASEFRAAIAKAPSIQLYEGLPHQLFEGDLFVQESSREDVIKIGGYPFYTPSLLLEDSSILRQLIGDPKNIETFSGEKLCGGFHPDYCVSWQLDGKVFQVLICFNCQEIIFHKTGRILRYDLKKETLKALKKDLSKYVSKRPKKN